MSKRIYTYTDLKSLKASEYYEKIKKYPQIAYTSGLKMDDKKIEVCDIKKLTSIIIPGWASEYFKFRLVVLISEYIRKKKRIAKNEKEIRWYSMCRKSINSIWSTIVLLEEANVKPEDLVSDEKEVKFFVDVWKYIYKVEPNLLNCNKCLSDMNEKEAWDKCFEEVFKVKDIKSIVVHGFYYITPIQQRVLDSIEKAGYDLIFLFMYDDRYPYVNEIWRNTYSEKNGYPSVDKWKMCQGEKIDVMGQLFEGEKVDEIPNIKIIEYKSVVDFVENIKQTYDKGNMIYASNHSSVNSILKDFYPEKYGERKLLSYPVGQFVYNLNNMWNEDEGEIILESDKLMQFFSSGWLSDGDDSAKRYMQDLKYIMPFFEGCRTYNEWINRINYLKEVSEGVVKTFTDNVSVEDYKENRWQQIEGNPFLNFSFFAVPRENLERILKFINQLLDMSKDLFGTQETKNIKTHMDKLNDIISKNDVSEDLLIEERLIVKELKKKLNNINSFSFKCFPSDISTALTLLLEERFDDEEKNDIELMVKPLYKADIISIKGNGKIHICFCDADNMPGKESNYIWPLNEKLIISMYETTKNKYLENLMYILQARPIANRYFFCSALKNKYTELSWISVRSGKSITKSPYLKMLNEIAGVKVNRIKKRVITYQGVEESEYNNTKIEEYLEFKPAKHVAREAKMDYAICSMRYILGYVIEKYPTYQTIFLQNYAINGLVRAIYFLMKDYNLSSTEIYENIIVLFPNLRQIEKRQIRDYLSLDENQESLDHGNRSVCFGYQHTNERLKVRYPYRDLRYEVDEHYNSLYRMDGKKGIDVYKETDVKSACVFCPHVEYCINAIYAVDQEKYYD